MLRRVIIFVPLSGRGVKKITGGLSAGDAVLVIANTVEYGNKCIPGFDFQQRQEVPAIECVNGQNELAELIIISIGDHVLLAKDALACGNKCSWDGENRDKRGQQAATFFKSVPSASFLSSLSSS